MSADSKHLVEDILKRGVANIIPDQAKLKELLVGKKKLRVYLGVDPTAVHIHLGHAVLLRKLQKLAALGHEVTFLIGDFTALIGDTSDKDAERPRLTSEQIRENFVTYREQAEKILDFGKVKLVHNSDWLAKLTFEDIVKLTQHFSAGDFVSRELIKKRLEAGQKVGLHELLYPVMQGYDSYHLDTDLQLGGTDQTFNMQAGRTLQKDLRHKESFILAGEFLPGTDGRKMSKSWGNAIWLDDAPKDIYGKVMSLKDDLLIPYFTLATELPLAKVEAINDGLKSGALAPFEAKKQLAHQIVFELYDEAAAQQASTEFAQVFQLKGVPSDVEEFRVRDNRGLVELMVTAKLASSNTDAKRLIGQGAVTLDEKRITDINFSLGPVAKEQILKVGKRRFIKLI